MIINNITYWRSTMNEGKGISLAHLARRVGVGRSFVTKLEKGSAQPGAELMFRVARYFKQPVEAIFNHVDRADISSLHISDILIPASQFIELSLISAASMSRRSATPPARPAGREKMKDKSLPSATAKEVASLSRRKPKAKT